MHDFNKACQNIVNYIATHFKSMQIVIIFILYHIKITLPTIVFSRNYVVQFIIEMQYPSAIVKLTNQFKGNYVSLSMQKFSSHVVEKCLTYIAETRARIVQELLSVSHFEQMLQDPYANYVVQKALELTTV